MRALPTLVALSALAAVPAQAQELNRGTQRLELSGNADPACVAGSGRPLRQDNATWQDGGTGGGSVVIPVLVDQTTATTRGSTIELALPLTCNSSHTITVRSYNGGLLRDGASGRNAAGGFSEFQSYGVSMTWQTQSSQLGGPSGTAVLATSQAAKGDLIVDIVVPRGTRPLVAGTYRDAVVIEIRPSN